MPADLALAATTRSQAPCARLSAPTLLIVSSPLIDSTRMPCFCAASRRLARMDRFSGSCSSNPTASTNGTAMAGTSASQPPISQITPMNRSRNGRSTRAVIDGRGEEVAQALELAQIVGEGAGRDRAGRHLQAHHLGEHGAGQLDVGDPAGGVDEIAAQHLEQEVEAEHDQHAAGEHPQGLDRVVRHDAVVDVHDEQRARQREQVDQHRGHGDLAIDRPLTQDDAPEPVPATTGTRLGGTTGGQELRPGEQGVACIACRQLGTGHRHRPQAGLRAGSPCTSLAPASTRTQACRPSSRRTQGRVSGSISSSRRRSSRALSPARAAARGNRSGVRPASARGRPAVNAAADIGRPSNRASAIRQPSSGSSGSAGSRRTCHAAGTPASARSPDGVTVDQSLGRLGAQRRRVVFGSHSARRRSMVGRGSSIRRLRISCHQERFTRKP